MDRELIAIPSKHRKRCDMLRCTNMSVMEFARTNSKAGRLDLCQPCINEIAQYAGTAEPPALSPTEPTEQATPTEFVCKYCRRVCASAFGLYAHEKACAKKAAG